MTIAFQVREAAVLDALRPLEVTELKEPTEPKAAVCRDVVLQSEPEPELEQAAVLEVPAVYRPMPHAAPRREAESGQEIRFA